MVENSWGAASGYQGHLIMTDEWFNEYMFRLVLETKYVPKKVQDIFKQKPIQLPAWDPMFAEENDDRAEITWLRACFIGRNIFSL